MPTKSKYTKNQIEKYYNEFNEENRLLTRHGQVEYLTTMKYIEKYLKQGDKIIEIGAGTGRYSVSLSNKGFDVTAVELVKHNVEMIKAKKSAVKVYQGNALDLSMFPNDSFEITLLFGPMYHLFTSEEKIKALSEAKRITRPGGHIFVAYFMNEYGIITYGFKKHNMIDCKMENRVDEKYHMLPGNKDLYDMSRIEDIDFYNEKCQLKRVKIIASDGPANYLRPFLNEMSEEEFNLFLEYHYQTCERLDLLGASSHTLDILAKE